ncbi:MAG TPA: hypothetical protein VKX49_15405 [Bryobacteraceae bacterium]|nr:hypothetical protein [Bryobacteraceae bacterium]
MLPDKSSRRQILKVPATAVLGMSILLAESPAEKGRLSVRLSKATEPLPAGLHSLGLRSARDALLYIPESAANFKQAPLIVSLHGAGRNSERGIELLRSLSDQHGFLVLAPASIAPTWDVIHASYGPDIAFLDQCLSRTFELRDIDRKRIGLAGFSDGASYSLSVGLTNGDFFRAVLGFSPGFVVPGEFFGRPPIFISHGTIDPILPIDECSRLIVPALKRSGYRVTYREFEGKHTLPPEVAAEAMRWFLQFS